MILNIGQYFKNSYHYLNNNEKINSKKICDFFESTTNIVHPIFLNIQAVGMSYTRSLVDYIWVPRTASSATEQIDIDLTAELHEELQDEIEHQRQAALLANTATLNVDEITSTISTIFAFVLPPLCALLSVDSTIYKSVFTPLSLMTALPNTNKTSMLSQALDMNVPVSDTEQLLYAGAVLSVAKIIIMIAGTATIGTAMPAVSIITAIAALPPIRNAVIKTGMFQALTKTANVILGNANEYVVFNLAYQIQKCKLVSKLYPIVWSGFNHMLTAIDSSEVTQFQNTAKEMLASARSVINESTGNAAVKSTLSQGGLGRAAISHFAIQPAAVQVVNFETAASRMLAEMFVSSVVGVVKSIAKNHVIGIAMVTIAVSHPVIATVGFVLAGGKMTAFNFFTRVAAAGVLWTTKSPLAASSVILVVDGMKLYLDLRRTARANLEKANAKAKIKANQGKIKSPIETLSTKHRAGAFDNALAFISSASTPKATKVTSLKKSNTHVNLEKVNAKADEAAKIKANQGKIKSPIETLSTKHTAGAFDNALAFISSASTPKATKGDNPNNKITLKSNTLAIAEKAKQKATIQTNPEKVTASAEILSSKRVTIGTFANPLNSIPSKATKVISANKKQGYLSIFSGQLQQSKTLPMPILVDGIFRDHAINKFYRGSFNKITLKSNTLAIAEKAKQKATIQTNPEKVTASAEILSSKRVTIGTFANPLNSIPSKATKVISANKKQGYLSIFSGQLQQSKTLPMPILVDGIFRDHAINKFYRGSLFAKATTI